MKMLENLNLVKVDYDEALAQDLYECSIVELYGQCSLGTPRIQKMLKGSLAPDGSLICLDGRVCIQVQRTCVPSQNSGIFLPEFAIGLDWQPWCTPIIQQQLPAAYGGAAQIINGIIPLRAKFTFIRLARLSSGDFTDCNEAFSESDRRHGKYLYKMLNLAKWSPGQENESWRRSFIDPWEYADVVAAVLTYYDADSIFSHNAEFVYWHGKLAFLHLAYFQHPDCYQPLRLYIPVDKPILFNEHKLAQNPKATVLLTDDPGLLWCNSDLPDLIPVGLFGGECEIDNVNIDTLRNRDLVWPILDDGGPERYRSYGRAVQVKARLAREKIRLEIAVYNIESWYFEPSRPSVPERIYYKVGKLKDFHIVGDAEFIKVAQSLGVRIPDILRPDRFGAVDITDKKKDTGELIEGLVAAGEVTTMNEFSGVKQFRFSHAIIDGAVTGGNILGTYHKPKRQLRTLVFVSPGMEQRYLRHWTIANSDSWKLYSSNFLYQSVEDALTTFKGALNEYNADIVLFEAEEFFSGSANRIVTVKSAINFCRQLRKGVIIIFNKDVYMTDIPAWLESTADRKVNIMPIPNTVQSYVIENFSGLSPKSERFKAEFTDSGIKTSDVSDSELLKIENREVLDKHLDANIKFDEYLNGASAEALLSTIQSVNVAK